jgi:hypothetical protein
VRQRDEAGRGDLARPDFVACLAADYNLEFAKAYAPMLWFAVDEPVYPTLPHPFAFDGVALDTGTRPCDLRLAPPSQKPDFEDPSELTLDER